MSEDGHNESEIDRLRAELAAAKAEVEEMNLRIKALDLSARLAIDLRQKADTEVERLRAAIAEALANASSCDGCITDMVRILCAAGRGEGER